MVAYIAICSEEYLKYYEELFKSLKEHSPDSPQILYYIGEAKGLTTLISNNSFDVINDFTDNFHNCNPEYDTLTRICSLRARAVLHAFKEGYDKVVFCGAKIKFFNKPHDLEVLLDMQDVRAVVTPHITEPLPEDGKYPSNEQVSWTGHISTDLVGFKNHPKIVEFLQWQDEIMKTKCKTTSKTYLDQSWLNCLPFFVRDVHIFRDPSYNVAYWNYKQRNLHKTSRGWVVDGPYEMRYPLVCFQFSGLPLDNPAKISTHQNREVAEGDFLEFLSEYAMSVK